MGYGGLKGGLCYLPPVRAAGFFAVRLAYLQYFAQPISIKQNS